LVKKKKRLRGGKQGGWLREGAGRQKKKENRNSWAGGKKDPRGKPQEGKSKKKFEKKGKGSRKKAPKLEGGAFRGEKKEE